MNCQSPDARLREYATGLKGALDDRQQREFHRHAAFLDLGRDVVQVTGATLEDAVEVIGLASIPLDFAVHGPLIDLGQYEPGTDAAQHVR
jgi:hypothetical protein